MANVDEWEQSTWSLEKKGSWEFILVIVLNTLTCG